MFHIVHVGKYCTDVHQNLTFCRLGKGHTAKNSGAITGYQLVEAHLKMQEPLTFVINKHMLSYQTLNSIPLLE